jgi:hypothetical protein
VPAEGFLGKKFSRRLWRTTPRTVRLTRGGRAAGVGPYLGAAVARLFEEADAALGPLEFDANRWVFVVRSVLLLTPLLLIPRLSRECGGKLGEALRRLSIHARGLKAFGR